ncbi:MAG: hypothetical protein SW833_03900 [Cyanobacteriota bacterium]|nr:hypothetical protein [Cyanobacteriota bacterium]
MLNARSTAKKKGSPKGFWSDRNLDLGDYICIQKETITPQQAIVGGIEFQLTPELLERIQIAKSRRETLYFKSSFLTELRNYAMSGDAIAFSTFYGESATEEAVMRSLISFEGEMNHQVCRYWLEDAALALQIISCHHWLISQILRGLSLGPVRSHNGIAWGIVALIGAGILAFNWQNFLVAGGTGWLVLLVFLWLVQRAIAFILNRLSPGLRRWFLYQMLFGSFSGTENQRKKALAIVSKL